MTLESQTESLSAKQGASVLKAAARVSAFSLQPLCVSLVLHE